jgi:hypothetical protein
MEIPPSPGSGGYRASVAQLTDCALHFSFPEQPFHSVDVERLILRDWWRRDWTYVRIEQRRM